ncbi:MAG: FKBP-type peptidyl-prolyl cis-trans isomerase [Prevotellaceae bacterium]|nr:FKBP-type peptidyl-prolyl cis-trans isomerase [Prevotellaceae bacterium]
MKSKVILACLLAAFCLTASAGKKKDKVVAKTPAVLAIDTLQIDTFSYAAGKANTVGLKPYLVQRMGVDTTYMADFMLGFDTDSMTVADKREKARLAGIEIRSQVEKQIFPQISKQVNDTADVLNRLLFVAGFRSGISEENDLLPIPMDSTQAFVKRQMDRYHAELMEAKYGPNRRAGEEFLRENATKDSVHVTESGLQYKVLVEGTGDIPTAKQKVKVNYRGTLLDGTEFDSSYSRKQPSTFTCSQVIKGWGEALTMMPVGSKWELYIPQELAYGERESGKIPPYSMLIFEVELVDIVK